MICYMSKYSGFCFGVSLAVKAAYDNKSEQLCMYGEVVHNPVVIDELKKHNIPIVTTVEQAKTINKSKILIRAHGVSKKIMSDLENIGLKLIDKTCPKVKRVHKIVENASKDGYRVIIVGNPEHPEVQGIKGWCYSEPIIIENIEHAKKIIPNFNSNQKFCMVAQTTYNFEKYMQIYKYCTEFLHDIKFYDTVCKDTYNRQLEIRELSKKMDAVIVIGGKSSSNSSKLFQIACENCKSVFHIESKYDLNLHNLDSIDSIAICSGASTPNKSILEVIEYIKEYVEKNRRSFEIIDLKN